MIAKFQNKLNKYCLINRKYQLLNEKQFSSRFPDIQSEFLKKSWKYSYHKIQNNEIIKNTNELPKYSENEIENKLKEFNFISSDLYYYLNSKFDFKELKLDEERIERRLRNILAQRHQRILEEEINEINKKEKSRNIRNKNISRIAKAFIYLIIFGILFGSRIRDGFTPVDVLTKRIYEREVYKFDGSLCRDGTTSHSQGRGTCSWHKGVRRKFYKGDHKLSWVKCKILAKERSWIE